MPYGFSFDLTKISKSFFRELARVSKEKEIHKRLGTSARHIAEKFHLSQITGLDVPDTIQLVEDLVDVQVRNASERARFEKTQIRALFLPHCSRKHMDNKCNATFNPDIPSYKCAHCSPDCQINQATTMAEQKSYKVYVVPGGSCIVGVACGQELKLGGEALGKASLAGQAIPLIKNGCSNTRFSLQNLEKTL
jgi:hypothetical protein